MHKWKFVDLSWNIANCLCGYSYTPTKERKSTNTNKEVTCKTCKKYLLKEIKKELEKVTELRKKIDKQIIK